MVNAEVTRESLIKQIYLPNTTTVRGKVTVWGPTYWLTDLKHHAPDHFDLGVMKKPLWVIYVPLCLSRVHFLSPGVVLGTAPLYSPTPNGGQKDPQLSCVTCKSRPTQGSPLCHHLSVCLSQINVLAHWSRWHMCFLGTHFMFGLLWPIKYSQP